MSLLSMFYNTLCSLELFCPLIQLRSSRERLPKLLKALVGVIGILVGFLTLIIACLIVLVIRLISPIVLIRMGPIGGTGRIGNFAPDIEFYLSERDGLGHNARIIDLFFYQNPPLNSQIKVMAERQVLLFSWVRFLDMVNGKLPGSVKHSIEMNIRPNRTPNGIHSLLHNTPVHIEFTDEELKFGRGALKELGIPYGSPYVCFHARDSAYLDSYNPDGDWSYHDYRDCSVSNYLLAAEELAKGGFFAVRMGALVKEVLITNNPRVIDYATTARTDFLDIYLAAHCEFFLASASGIDTVATIFRRPIAFANWMPMGKPGTMGPNDIFITKKLWLKSEQRYLTFREIIHSEIGHFGASEQYENLGIEVIENSQEDILGLAIEMQQRLRGTWEISQYDNELQRRFWDLYEPLPDWKGVNTRFGSTFLRLNADLLL